MEALPFIVPGSVFSVVELYNEKSTLRAKKGN